MWSVDTGVVMALAMYMYMVVCRDIITYCVIIGDPISDRIVDYCNDLERRFR